MTGSFVHLHNHSEYSLLDGASRVTDLVKAAKRHHMPAVALTDHGNLFGALPFYQAAMKEDIKPILGCEVYLTRGNRFDKSTGGQKQNYHHLVLLAKHNEGYRNLMYLVSQAYTEGFYYKPRVDKELLKERADGLFCLTACLKGEIPHFLAEEQYDKAREALDEYLSIFGAENVFMEIMENGMPIQSKVNKGVIELAREKGVGLVATNDCHYVEPEDAEAHDILLCIQTQKTVDDPNRMKYSSNEFYFKSPEEMSRLFGYAPEAIANTLAIAEQCNVEIDFEKEHRPDFHLPDDRKGLSYEQYLRQLVYEGAKERYSELTEQITSRIDYELSVIHQMGYDSYFLIVWDFVNYARQKEIAVGPGRGSAAGSIVSYCLGITDLDPLAHGLLFERFLNPERVSMPDIDIDFSDKRREEVIRYVSQKYGEESVSMIATFGTMGAKMVVRDVGRALGYSASECDRVAKMIPNDLGTTIDKALEQSEELRDWISSDRKNEKLIKIAKRLEGMARQSSTHAAGIVIAKGDLRDYTPLMRTNKGEISSQLDKKFIEKIGLLKMDFLGLRTLSIIEDTINFLRQRDIELDLKEIPVDDSETFKLLSAARTNGVFQLESAGMKDILKKLQPETFSDIVALLALYRPGPLGSGMVEDFINRKHDRVEITYDHPELKPILEETYGIILYQEQVMKIANVIAGFTLGGADLMRRAMGKKDKELMEKVRAEFLEGAKKQNVAQAVAEKLWRLIEHFAGYGFNKSHSAAYAVLSYQTAYLKAHHPTEFMASLLTNEINNTDRVVRFANDCRAMGIALLPPCVNESLGTFAVKEKSIRFGLSGIKNVGLSAVRSIIKSREEDGPYKSLLDFCERVDLSAVNGRVLESLTRSGSLDCFGRTRSELLELLPEAQERAAGSQKDRSAGQFSLFGEVKAESEADLPVLNRPELPQQEILKSEKQLLGIYLSGHPLNEHAQYLDLLSTASTAEIAEMDTVSGLRIGGVITGINRKTTKSGERMAILSLEDLEGEIEVVIFPEMFRNNLNLIQEEQVIVVEGDGDSRGGKHSLRASKIWSLDQAREELIRSVHLHFMDSTLDGSLLKKLKDKLISYPGQARLLLHFRLKEEDEVVISANEKYKVRPGPELIQAVSEVVTEPVLTYEVAKVSGNGRDGGNGRRGGGGYNGGRRFR